ncbi:MAG: YraN family protein [Rikenellaceae bacterium]|jgi:putative endonuclease|nr:YraN family protein [Rikenellaceae bacterium]
MTCPPDSSGPDKRAIGFAGEDVAARWLEDNDFQLLARNWRAGRYELDIVALGPGGVIHFVEVKTRKPGALTAPEEAITYAKFASLLPAARSWLARHAPDAESQFDLIAVQGNEVRYVPNAMVPSW